MSLRSALTLAVLLVIGAHGAPEALHAQSATSGTVSGTVRSEGFRPVVRALVTLNPVGAGTVYQATTTAAGTFSFRLVQPGSYEVRAEALGYRPVIARVLTVSGGEDRAVSLTLTSARPPVTQVDTVTLAGASSTRWRGGAVQMGGGDIDLLPHRFEDLASISALSTSFDESLGVQGLPGELTLIEADGVPFYRAPHPVARQELLPDALFTRSTLASVGAVENSDEVEWGGSPGGYVSIGTRASAGVNRLEVDGAYSGKPFWSSSELDIEKPSLLSWEGSARGLVSVSRSASLLLSGEGLSQQTPLAPRISSALAEDLSGLDAGLLADLTGPGVEQYDRYSGMVRLDVQQSRSSQLFFRGLGSYSRRDFEGAGPVTLAGPAAPSEKSTNFSTAFGVTSEYSRSTTIEFRAGFSGSYRDFGSSIPGRVPALLAGAGAELGDVRSSQGKSSRTDFVATPLIRWALAAGTFKLGGTLRASMHTITHARLGLGDFVYSDAAALQVGRGFGATTSAPEASFGTQEYGLFGQFETNLAPGLRLRFGGRYDYEMIGGDGAPLDESWLLTSGLRNNVFKDTFHQFGATGSLAWDPVVDGPTRISMIASMREGDVDPRAIAEVYAGAEATSRRYAGTDLTWPEADIPALAAPALRSLTMLGPDTRAPRTTNVSVALIQRVGTATLFVRGSSRRTDFLMRRRNLNIPLLPQALDPAGRPVYGTLVQDGALVTTTSDDARRFAGFGEAWALDPDGWSRYMGVTAGIEHGGSTLDLFGSYTYSETTDNWIGASTGSIDASLDPGLPLTEGADPWSEGRSDFDIPHRVAVGATVRIAAASIAATYRYRSGTPFTPRYRAGVDANGDGSIRNDIAFIPDDGSVSPLLDSWTCVTGQAGTFAERNSCRGPAVHTLNARIQFTLGRVVGRRANLMIDGFNLLDSKAGVIDDALLLADPAGSIETSPDGSTLTVPTTVNGAFGNVVYPSTRGRMLRLGVRIGI